MHCERFVLDNLIFSLAIYLIFKYHIQQRPDKGDILTKKIKRTAIAGSIAVAFGAIAMFALLGAIGEHISKKNNVEIEGDAHAEDVAVAIMDAAGRIPRN